MDFSVANLLSVDERIILKIAFFLKETKVYGITQIEKKRMSSICFKGLVTGRWLRAKESKR